MSQAKTDCQTLVDEWLKFATHMLEEHGEFIPYGCAMNLVGEIGSYAADIGGEHPNSQEVISFLQSAFRGQKADLKCTAIFYDVVIRNPEETDAVAVLLDHEDNYSRIVFFPYQLTDGVVKYGAAFLNAGSNDIFGNLQ